LFNLKIDSHKFNGQITVFPSPPSTYYVLAENIYNEQALVANTHVACCCHAN